METLMNIPLNCKLWFELCGRGISTVETTWSNGEALQEAVTLPELAFVPSNKEQEKEPKVMD